MRRLTPGHAHYLVGRSIASTLALLFALYYSKELGVIGRSYLVLIMSCCALIGIFLTSGTTLTLRTLYHKEFEKSQISSFNSLILIEILIGSSLLLGILITFSHLKYYLHPTLMLIAILYFALSISHLVVFEVLVALKSFKHLLASDLLTIFLQILFYFSLRSLTTFSTASCVLLAFITSYLIIVIFFLFLAKRIFEYPLRLDNPRVFLNKTKGKHLFGLALGIIDRSDRLIIALFLPISFLGKYAVMSGFVSFFRFIPESVGKLIVSVKADFWIRKLERKYLWFGGLALSFPISLVIQSIIDLALGAQWLLSVSVTFMYTLQELARAAFQLATSSQLAIGHASRVQKASVLLLLTSIPLAVLFSISFGIIGVPLAFFLTYLLGLFKLKSKG